MQFSNGVSANTHKGFSLEILMTMAHILDEGVLSLSIRLERAIRTRRPSQTRKRGGRSTTSKEAPTSGEEGRHRPKGNRDQRCYV
jgi:hypothetical protein